MRSRNIAIMLLCAAWITMSIYYLGCTMRLKDCQNGKQEPDINLRMYQHLDSMNQGTIKALYDINTKQQHRFDSLLKVANARKVTATVYYPTGDQMRSGKLIPRGYTLGNASPKYIAISQDLWSANGGPYSFGDSVRIIGTPYDGIYVIEDTMNKRHKNRVDILVSGKVNEQWHNVKIYKV